MYECVCSRVTVTPRVPLRAKRGEFFWFFFLSIYGYENRIKLIIIMKNEKIILDIIHRIFYQYVYEYIVYEFMIIIDYLISRKKK